MSLHSFQLLGSYLKYLAEEPVHEMEKAKQFAREAGFLPEEKKEEGVSQQPEELKPAAKLEETMKPGQLKETQEGQELERQKEQKSDVQATEGQTQPQAEAQQQPQQRNIPKNMKAARVVEFGKPLEIQDVDVPQPGPGEALVRLRFCGVCHTDVEMRDGSLSKKPENLPFTIGHEGVGEVFATGPGVENVKEGDRVLCGVLANACGCCRDCLEGCETACSQCELSGVTRDGQMAQFFLAKAQYLCKLPENVTDEAAAPINCAGVTTWKALKVSGLRCGQWVVIVGAAGGLGYYAVQFAKAMGLKVIAVDKGQEKIDFLKQFEAIHILNCDEGKENVENKIMKLTNDCGAHSVLVLAPCKEAFQDAQKILRKRGKLVVVGQPPSKDLVDFDMASLIVNCHTVVGSLAGTRCDLWEALQLLSDGVIKSEVHVRDFNEINNILEELSKGEVLGRNVVKIPELRQE